MATVELQFDDKGRATVILQQTNLGGNNNKFWEARWTPDAPGSGHGMLVRRWGRVGASGQSKTEPYSLSGVRAMAQKKLDEGYNQVLMNEKAAPAPVVQHTALGREENQLLQWIGFSATQHIGTYFVGDLSAMSPAHIQTARDVLAQIAQPRTVDRNTIDLVQRYYNLIPTQLPSRIDPTQVAVQLRNGLAEQEDRLNQLEAAAQAAAPATAVSGVSLPFEVRNVSGSEKLYGEVVDWVTKTNAHGRRFKPKAFYEVKVDHERKRYEGCSIDNTVSLFHGTRTQNVQHILRQGLKVPSHLTNGWMFGAGVYLADKASKSMQYTSSGYGAPQMMFITEAKLGKQYVAPDACSSLRKAPSGFDSVWGKENHTGSWGGKLRFNEFIVYDPAQVTLRGILCFEE